MTDPIITSRVSANSASATSRVLATKTSPAGIGQAQDHSSSSAVSPLPRRERRYSADTANFIAMVGDIAMIVVGLVIGFWLRFVSGFIPRTETWWTSGDSSRITFSEYIGLIVMGAALLFASFLYQHLYRAQNLLRFRRVAHIVTRSAVVWLAAYLGLSLALKFDPPISRIYVLLSFLATLGTVLTWRYLYQRALRFGPFAKSLRQRLLFVGWNAEAAKLAELIHADSAQPYDIVGCVPSPGGQYLLNPAGRLRQLGDYQELPEILFGQNVEIVVLADLDTKTGEIVGLTNLCERLMVQFKIIPSYFQILVSGLQLETISGVPILGVEELPLDRMHNRILKRTVDIIGAIIGLILAAPIIALFGCLIRLESPGPIFYRQVRTGRNGEDFEIIKLRSMKLDAEEKGGAQWAKKGDDRRLKIGAFLREWNLDEVPQFWNVLKGEMSLVGPRPERPELIANFQFEIPHYNARLASKPGITGWAQVNGLRGDTDLSERVRYDLFYLENWSLWLDFQIMFQTFVSRKNAY